MTDPNSEREALHIRYLTDFLYSGSSALLLAIAHVHNGMWIAATFALVPFLWRVTRVGLRRSIIISGMLGISYVGVTHPITLTAFPTVFCLKSVGMWGIFLTFAVAVNVLKGRLGFYPVFIATLWLPLEYLIGGATGLGGVLALGGSGSEVLVRISSLCGVLVVSYLVILVNLLVLEILERVAQSSAATSWTVASTKDESFAPAGATMSLRVLYFSPLTRAPPVFSCSQ